MDEGLAARGWFPVRHNDVSRYRRDLSAERTTRKILTLIPASAAAYSNGRLLWESADA